MRTGAVALALLALAAASTPLPDAAAQPAGQAEPCRPPVLSMQQPPGPFPPSGSVSLLFAIENPNGAPVEAVRATITTTAPAGWTATVAQRDITLGPRDVRANALAITAPNRGSGAAGGNVTIAVTFVCTSGDIQTVSSVNDVVPVEMERFSVPWPLVLGGFGVLAAGVTVLGLRRLRRGVALSSTEPDRTLAPGKSAKYTFVVENRRGRPQRFRLAADGLPEGWSVHLALDEVELEPGEEKTLWALLRAPAHAPPGEAVALTLRLVAPGAQRDAASLRLHAVVAEAP